MTSSRMRGRKARSPMKQERDLSFRKGAGLVSVNERVRTQQTASSLSKGSRREHQRGRAPWTRGWHHPRIPDSARGKQVLGLWHGGRSRREHTHLRGATRARAKHQPPHLQTAHQFLAPESKRELFWGSFLFVVPGGRRAQVSPRVLRVSELQGGDRGQGHLRLGGAIQTLLVRPPHQFL